MKKVTKLLIILLTFCTVCALVVAASAANNTLINPELIFKPQTTLSVLVDGVENEALSGNYPYGEEASISAPTVSEKTFQYWTNGEGTIISYSQNLTLKMYSNTTVKAEYGTSQAASETVAAFLNVTRTDGEIIFNAIASSGSAGIRYSTTKQTLDDLKGEDGVTVAPADETPNWALVITPENEDTTYYALAYTTVGTETTYSDVKAVKLSELQNGISMVTNLGDLDLSALNAEFCVVSFDPNGGEGVIAPQGAVKGEATVLNANTFTREGYTFSGWSTEEGGSVVYKDGETVTPEGNLVLYAQWTQNRRSGGGGGGGGGSSASSKVNVYSSGTSANGKVSLSKTNPSKGEIVKITVTPDEGYETDSVTVTDKDGNAIEVTKNEDGTYSYVQPAGNVTITPTFKKTSAEPENSPSPQPTEKPSGDSEKWFKDVPETTWYYAPIKEAFDTERMSGMSEDYFEPETDITRGMFAYAIYRREGLPETDAQNMFEDVMSATYYEKAIAWATENGIVAGIDDTHYAPDDQITREQMAAILYRYAQLKEYDVSVGEDTNILDFTDAIDISEYAMPAIRWAVGDKVITGFEDGSMLPKSNANRAQMAVILNKISNMF